MLVELYYHRNLKVSMANTTNKPQSIPAGTCLGKAVSVTVVAEDELNEPVSAHIAAETEENKTSVVAEDIIQPVLEKLPPDVTAIQQHQVVSLLCEYDDVFSRGMFDMSRTTLVEHTIDTGNNRGPLRQCLRRHPERIWKRSIDKSLNFFRTT